MGNREDLLEAARACLRERGLSTTARDIASEAGVSLAAIGYHFGTKDALLAQAANEAIGDALGAWIEKTLGETPAGADPGTTFAEFCGRLPEAFASVQTHLLTSLEHLTRLVRTGDSPTTMAPAMRQSTDALTKILGAVHPQLPPSELDGLAQLYHVAINGASLIWLAAPDSAPTAEHYQHAVAALTSS
ncbi:MULTISPECIES: TetR/AcrR family transcriptional regulator [Amycolatopsis]|uniref:TetR/AcrR family transcriptional regulator n=1 Tax=Amycolatopsis sp. cg13 TaxID=3238807 RepID=UPI003526BFC1